METRVNVIYIAGSVHLLLPFLETLLEHTDWPLRLVMNGCSDRERGLLEAIATEHRDRVELRTESLDVVVQHGEVLDRLSALESGPFFCFVDSDVFAASRTDLSELLPAHGEAACCSCLPIWQRVEEAVAPHGSSVMAGEYLWTADGDSLGCSHLATYRTDQLRGVLEDWGVSFRPYKWDDLPEAVRIEFERHDLRWAEYDTAKVVNLLLQIRGRPVSYRAIPSLVHLGGLSGLMLRSTGVLRRALRSVRRRVPIAGRLVQRGRRLNRVDRRSFADIERRRDELTRLLAAMRVNSARFDEAPEWLTDREVFEATARLLASSSAEVPRV